MSGNLENVKNNSLPLDKIVPHKFSASLLQPNYSSLNILLLIRYNCLMGALFISRICDQFLVFIIYNFPRYCDK